MKTALLLTGNARFSEDFDSQLLNLQKSNIDVYVCFWKREDGFDPKISKNWLVNNSLDILNKLKPHLPWWYSIKFAEVLNVEDFDPIPKDYEPFNSNPVNVWQQYKCLQWW